jgi:hypothetical protein
MRPLQRALLCLFLTLMSACSSRRPPPVTVATPTPVEIPARLLSDCQLAPRGDLGDGVAALIAALRCEWTRNAELRAWAARIDPP